VAGGSYRPGVPMNVTVRGVRSIAAGNQPLYVVDGVPLAGGIEDFNPAIIQSIEVLKDASATAVYGSRGSNGVILITTRRGAAGNSRLSLIGSYFDQDGITIGQGYRQYSGTVSFENTYRRLRIGVTATGTRSIADIGADASLWGEALANNPLGLPYDSAGVPS